jgi:hypothetical protein
VTSGLTLDWPICVNCATSNGAGVVTLSIGEQKTGEILDSAQAAATVACQIRQPGCAPPQAGAGHGRWPSDQVVRFSPPGSAPSLRSRSWTNRQQLYLGPPGTKACMQYAQALPKCRVMTGSGIRLGEYVELGEVRPDERRRAGGAGANVCALNAGDTRTRVTHGNPPAFCGTQFKPSGRGSPQRFCRSACRLAFHSAARRRTAGDRGRPANHRQSSERASKAVHASAMR